MAYKDPEVKREFYRKREARRRQQRIDAGLNSRGQARRPHFIPKRPPITRTDEILDREALAWLDRLASGGRYG